MKSYLSFLFLFFGIQLQAQLSEQMWVDSVFNSLTPDERIGQLFMVRAYSKADNADVAKISKLVKDQKIGGICFFQGDPERQAKLVNQYQAAAKTPLMIAIDGEWGLGMRFKEDAISFPRQIMLGAIKDNNLIEQMGGMIADHCKRIGINVNFAPVVDINNNPKNPVINDRSFGEDKYNVASKSYAYMKGLQDNGVIACSKHFPGHGDTDVDSHYDLPVIYHSMDRINDLELFPFRALINQGIESMMVAHLHIPSIDDRENRATTLSEKAVTGILRNQLGFEGLIFTDALDMKGVAKHFETGVVDAEALKAGNDVLLLSEDVPKAIKAINSYIQKNLIPQVQVDASVKRILRAKHRLDLHKRESIPLKGIDKDINDDRALGLKARLIEEAITLVMDPKDLVPIAKTADKKVLSIAVGSKGKNVFQERLNSYADVVSKQLSWNISDAVGESITEEANRYNHVIISLHGMSKSASKNFGVNKSIIRLINNLEANTNVVTVIFGNPYSLTMFDEVNTSILLAYEDDDLVRDITAQSLFGVNAIRGSLPVTASPKYIYSMGIERPSLGRMGYSIPERVGLDGEVLNGIDVVVDDMLKKKAAPGCQVLVAKNGKIVFQKAYGYHKYDGKQKVKEDDIYDVASLTKVLSGTLAVMKLVDEGKMSLDATVSRYIPEADTSNKANVIIKDMMAHHARLKPWIPFYSNTLTKSKRYPKPDPIYYSKNLSADFSIPVAKDLFLRNDYRDTMWSIILGSELRDSDSYRYSDLGFYMVYKSVENLTGMTFDQFLNKQFYAPLELSNIGFNPLNKFDKRRIVPSERDQYFRYQDLQGYVHDMGAAMLGGVSGHAGLFASSFDVAVIMQMLLNGGEYAGVRYLNQETINKFTKRHPKSTRRGIGFDMKQLDSSKTMNMSELASERAFGHIGFTGTATFADPEHDIIYVFLSNRTYPTMKNNKLNRNDYRPKIQSLIYEAMIDKEDVVMFP